MLLSPDNALSKDMCVIKVSLWVSILWFMYRQSGQTAPSSMGQNAHYLGHMRSSCFTKVVSQIEDFSYLIVDKVVRVSWILSE